MAMSTWVLAGRYVHYETGEAELYHIDYQRQCAGRRPAAAGATADADADAAEEVRNLLAATGEATAEQQAKYGEIASRCMEIPVILICAQREYLFHLEIMYVSMRLNCFGACRLRAALVEHWLRNAAVASSSIAGTGACTINQPL